MLNKQASKFTTYLMLPNDVIPFPLAKEFINLLRKQMKLSGAFLAYKIASVNEP